MQVDIRDGTADDHNFVLATMLRAVKYGSDYFRAMDREIYFSRFGVYISTLFKAPGRLKVACMPGETGDDGLILGYALLQGEVLHFVYVKSAFRNQGIAAQLLAGENIKKVSSMTAVGEALRQKKGYIFDPWS